MNKKFLNLLIIPQFQFFLYIFVIFHQLVSKKKYENCMKYHKNHVYNNILLVIQS